MEVRLRSLPRLLVLALLGATAAPSSWSCGVPDAAVFQDQNLQDLSWVQASASIFVSYSQGPTFHLQFAPYSQTMIGERAGERISPITLSPDKQWLLYSLGGGPEYRLYNTRSREIHRPDMPLGRFSIFAFSGDSRFLAAPVHNGADQGISVLDLTTRSSRAYFPAGKVKPQGIAGPIGWSDDSRTILITYRNRDGTSTA